MLSDQHNNSPDVGQQYAVSLNRIRRMATRLLYVGPLNKLLNCASARSRYENTELMRALCSLYTADIFFYIFIKPLLLRVALIGQRMTSQNVGNSRSI